MYTVVREELDFLKQCVTQDYGNTVFTTYAWLSFLKENQHAEPVVLKLLDHDRPCAVFVGMIIKKFGIRIIGSPFEGWLTCDMGFIHLDKFDVNDALKSVANYTFKHLNCWYMQVTDKRIKAEDLASDIKYYHSKIVYIDNSKSKEDVLAQFSKNGRRDVRASERKGATVKRVPFDRKFMDEYYKQLVDVFDKQGLKPFFSLKKLYDMVDAFGSESNSTLALVAYAPEGQPIATIFSLGYNDWGYYVGAASYREYQKLLPNELLFWNFVKHWNTAGVKHLDLVGVRSYKMKYGPELVDQPVVYFERIPGIKNLKDFAKNSIEKLREFKTKVNDYMKRHQKCNGEQNESKDRKQKEHQREEV